MSVGECTRAIEAETGKLTHFITARPMLPTRPTVLATALAAALSASAVAQTQALPLKPETVLRPPWVGEKASVFVFGEQISRNGEAQVEASGQAEMRSWRETLFSDWLRYDESTDELWAIGHVRMRHDRDRIAGPELRYRRESETGFARDATFAFTTPEHKVAAPEPGRPPTVIPPITGRGDAKNIEFAGPNRYVLTDARYTTCRAENEDWFLRVSDLDIDRNRQVGSGHHATVYFENVPILYTPWLDFPLTDERKSGFLTPSFGSTGKRGAEMSLPWYWNLAPNYDATFTPRFMSKRGLMLNGQFRYLWPSFNGELDAEGIEHDRPTGDNRFGLAFHHAQNLLPGLVANLNLNKVSDDNYFVDFADRISATSQITLPREASLAYNSPWGLSFLARIQRFQTLQDPAAPILPPYQREPQLVASGAWPDWHGLDVRFTAEYVRFQHPTLITGERLMVNPSVALPLHWHGFYVTPRVQYHSTDYQLDADTGLNAGSDVPVYTNTRRNLPIASIDAGVTLERDLRLFGQNLVQTLEPRLFYVNIPFREQTQIPVFDSALADVSYEQLFSENKYVGNDRINDANQLTLGATTRFLDAESGDERVRMGVAQRYYFESQQVVLNEPLRDSKVSDLVFFASGRLNTQWSVESGLQYDPDLHHTERLNFNLRYQPDAGKMLNGSYRYVRQLIDAQGLTTQVKQIDLAVQWPVSARWALQARWNYSLYDHKVLEAVAGLEYNGGCWALRVVGQRIATTTQSATSAVFLQLELNGLSRIGTNPLDVLRRNIPGYATANELEAERERTSRPEWYQPDY